MGKHLKGNQNPSPLFFLSASWLTSHEQLCSIRTPTMTLCLRRALRTMEPNGPWAEISEKRSRGRPLPFLNWSSWAFHHSDEKLTKQIHSGPSSSILPVLPAIVSLGLIRCWLKMRIPLLPWQLGTVKMTASRSQEALSHRKGSLEGGSQLPVEIWE